MKIHYANFNANILFKIVLTIHKKSNRRELFDCYGFEPN